MMEDMKSYFKRAHITSKGLALLLKAVNGGGLRFKRVVVGDGVTNENPLTLTSLVNEVETRRSGEEGDQPTADMVTFYREDERFIHIRIRVESGSRPFVWRELGIIAEDPDEGDILFARAEDSSDYAMLFATGSGSSSTVATADVGVFVEEADDISIAATFPAEVGYEEFNALRQEFREYKQKTEGLRRDVDYIMAIGGYAGDVTLRTWVSPDWSINHDSENTIIWSNVRDTPVLTNLAEVTFEADIEINDREFCHMRCSGDLEIYDAPQLSGTGRAAYVFCDLNIDTKTGYVFAVEEASPYIVPYSGSRVLRIPLGYIEYDYDDGMRTVDWISTENLQAENFTADIELHTEE